MTLAATWVMKKDFNYIVDAVINEFEKHKDKYELPWKTLQGGDLPSPVKFVIHEDSGWIEFV